MGVRWRWLRRYILIDQPLEINMTNLFVLKIKRKHYTLSEYIFYFTYMLHLTTGMLNRSMYAQYIPTFVYTGVACFCLISLSTLILMHTKMTLKLLGWMLVCLVLSVLLAIGMTNVLYLPMFLFIYTITFVDFDEVCRLTVITGTCVFIFVLLSARLGIINDYVYTYGERVRHYLGFRYALQPSAFLFNITAADLYYRRENKSFIRYIFWLLFNYLIYIQTDSRLSFILCVALLLVFWFLKPLKNFLAKHKAISFVLSMSYIICAAVSICLTIGYNKNVEWMRTLNEFLGYRLSIGLNAFLQYRFGLFGQKLYLIGQGLSSLGVKSTGDITYVDCLYLSILMRYGVIFFSLFIVIWEVATFRARKNEDFDLFLIFLILAVHAMIDDLTMSLYFNVFWLGIGKVLFSGHNRKKVLSCKTD